MFGIVANVKSDRVLRTGAKVHIVMCNGGAEDVFVTGLNKSGRRVYKYLPFKRLENFRAVFVPEIIRTHNRFHQVLTWPDKDAAKERADNLNIIWKDVRQFSRDGKTLVRDGVTTGEAFKRATELNAGFRHQVVPLVMMEG